MQTPDLTPADLAMLTPSDAQLAADVALLTPSAEQLAADVALILAIYAEPMTAGDLALLETPDYLALLEDSDAQLAADVQLLLTSEAEDAANMALILAISDQTMTAYIELLRTDYC